MKNNKALLTHSSTLDEILLLGKFIKNTDAIHDAFADFISTVQVVQTYHINRMSEGFNPIKKKDREVLYFKLYKHFMKFKKTLYVQMSKKDFKSIRSYLRNVQQAYSQTLKYIYIND